MCMQVNMCKCKMQYIYPSDGKFSYLVGFLTKESLNFFWVLGSRAIFWYKIETPAAREPNPKKSLKFRRLMS